MATGRPGPGARLSVALAAAVRADGTDVFLQWRLQTGRSRLACGDQSVFRPRRFDAGALVVCGVDRALLADAAADVDGDGLGSVVPRADAMALDANTGPVLRSGVAPGDLDQSGGRQLRAVCTM